MVETTQVGGIWNNLPDYWGVYVRKSPDGYFWAVGSLFETHGGKGFDWKPITKELYEHLLLFDEQRKTNNDRQEN
jgi:hypothetical protein